MPESGKRIIVDGIDFGSVFQFHRILRAIAMAMQPSRLVIALLMVAALVGAGKVWDAFTTPTINPKGFLAAPMTEDEERRAQLVFRQALREWGLEAPSDLNEEVDGRDVLRDIEDAYIERVDTTAENQRDVLAARYLNDVRDIQSVRPRGTFEATSEYVTRSFHRMLSGVVSPDPLEVLVGAYSLFVRTPVMLWNHDRWFALCYGLLFVIIVALGGGAISRMAACEMATGERLRIRDAVDFALVSWPRLLITPLLPLVIIAILCLVLALLGAVFMLPWIDIVGGALYGLALLLGLVIAVLMVGYAAGFSLLIPAVAVENCDAADAQQRGYAYVLSRPFHMLGYLLTALVGLTLGYLLVVFVALVVVTVSSAMVGFFNSNAAVHGHGEDVLLDVLKQVAQEQPPTGFGLDEADAGGSEDLRSAPLELRRVPPDTAHERVAAAGVQFWHSLVISLVVSYVVAFFFAASTIIYLLIRRKCDGQDITEIWRPGMIPGTLTPIPDQDLNESKPG